MNFLRYIACMCILTSFSTYGVTVNGKDNPLIIFDKENKYLLDHIVKSQLSPDYKFSTTSVIRFDNNKFISKGDVLNITEEDLKAIGSGNWVYTSFYGLAQTRLSQGQYEKVGAIILGTTDEKKARDLHFAHQFNTINNSKK